VLYFLSVSFLI